jgi:hypothetical protein
MKKNTGYYIIGAVLVGVGVFLLYNRIKKGNLKLNNSNASIIKNENGNHLEPPIEVPIIEVPTFATPPFV